MSRRYLQLNLADRRRLYHFVECKVPIHEMARQLGRRRSTIYREIRRNTFHDRELPEYSGYFPTIAYDISKQRRRRLRKLMRDPQLRELVIDRLKALRSPARRSLSVIIPTAASRSPTRGPLPHRTFDTLRSVHWSEVVEDRRLDDILQRRASFRTHKGRCKSLNLRIVLSENRFRFSGQCASAGRRNAGRVRAAALPLFAGVDVRLPRKVLCLTLRTG
ncbi:hypothetical protein J2Z50_002839 [Ensifer mexicanus]|nr:hypothetical protein [Sinorhizobium mexicanum]